MNRNAAFLSGACATAFSTVAGVWILSEGIGVFARSGETLEFLATAFACWTAAAVAFRSSDPADTPIRFLTSFGEAASLIVFIFCSVVFFAPLGSTFTGSVAQAVSICVTLWFVASWNEKMKKEFSV